MIDKIKGNDVYGYADQKKRKNPAVRAYENTPGQKEAAGHKIDQKRGTGSMKQPEKGSQGVILDLSSQSGREKAKAAQTDGEALSGVLTQTLRKLFAPVIRWLKNFWESDTAAAGNAGKMRPGSNQADAGGLQPQQGAAGQIDASMQQQKDAAGIDVEMSAAQGAAEHTAGQIQGQTEEMALTAEQGTAEYTARQQNDTAGQINAPTQQETSEYTAQQQKDAAADIQGQTADGRSGVLGTAASDLIQGSLEQAGEAADLTAQTAYEILESSRIETEDDLQGLPPLEDIDDLPKYGAISDEAVKSGNLEQIEQLLTRNGARQLAHNSDLLTYYDRRGRLIELDETQRYRVLHGDKNVLKL